MVSHFEGKSTTESRLDNFFSNSFNSFVQKYRWAIFILSLVWLVFSIINSVYIKRQV